MPHTFDAEIVTAVLRHMNGDHTDDNLLITRAFSENPDAITAATMTGVDGEAGVWEVTRDGETEELRIPWPGGPISERPEIRREVVVLYDQALQRLGLEPRA
ncbi:DUF2470 domain-containing protein [uncultured Agrococcus sp.]|uniref:DUF2470 domain-containing protein n=1 Tax=uncultured Agrococcus sp. TaxID=382258 RepID=UPI002601142E|nr:DUF2470 domain-containing protein [uncultured Agrococcus sp.]